jgi:hypothetical protein
MVERDSATDWWEAFKVDLPAGQHGRWAIERFSVGPGDRLQPYFRVYGRDCPPGTYTRLVRYEDGVPDIDETMNTAVAVGGHPVMTDTPGEIEDHCSVMAEIERRGGRILVHGLGIGLILKFALALPNVGHIDVVELDQDVIDLVAPHYRDERLQIHHGDARTFPWPSSSRWSVAWHDIWGDFQLENLNEMAAFERRFAGRVDWQECWSKDHLLAKQRRLRGK